MDIDQKVMAAAVRQSCAAPETLEREAMLLTDVVASEVFARHALAPPEVLQARALALLADWVAATEHDDEAVCDRFLATLSNLISKFELDAASCLDDDCNDFIRQAAVCFGVDEHLMPSLLVQFHKQTEPRRMGIYLAIEKSRPFGFLKNEIDRAPDDTPFDNPVASLRALNVATLATIQKD